MNKIVAVVLVSFLVACNNKENRSGISYAPKVTEINGYLVPKDSISEPKCIILGIPTTIQAGQPTVNPTNLNVHIAGQPNIIAAGAPKINTPGTGKFQLPKTIAATGKRKPTGIPEVIIAKDADAKDVNPANFSFYKTLQGLKNNAVRCLLQDKTGNIWIGTYGGGVCRYDGKSFTNFTQKDGLAHDVVSAILEDKTGNIWIGTFGGGVSRYDGKFFTNFTETEGLSNNFVYSILEDKTGNIWIGTQNGGVSRYDGKSFTKFTENEGLNSNGVLCILEDKNANLWFGTMGGVCRYDGKSFANFTKNEGLANNIVQSILEDKNGNIWFGTRGGGVSRYDGKSFANFTEEEGLSNNSVYSIIEDNSGNFWFGTYGGGACCYDGKTFISFTEKEGLSNNFVYSIFEDKTGSIWIGTQGGGICRYEGKSFTNFTETEGLCNTVVNAILEDKNGNIWFGTNGGASRYDEKSLPDGQASFTNFTEREGLCNNVINGILEDKAGNIWFATNGGACVYDGKSFTNFTEKEGLYSNGVICLLEDNAGNIWFGTLAGVCRYDGNRVEAIERGEKVPLKDQQDLKKVNGKLVKSLTNFTEEQGLSHNIVLSILEDKNGNIWFGTQGGGVCRYDGKSSPDGKASFTNFTEKEGLSNNLVYSILEDKTGNIWFGTNSGVCLYNEKSLADGQPSLIHLTEKEGLANNPVLSVMQDVEGNIWLGTRKGLSKVTPEKLAELIENKESYNPIKEAFFYNYGYNDGFLGLNCKRKSVLQDSRGRIWWGAGVLTCYNPKNDIPDAKPPIVNLTSLKLFGEEIAWASLNAVSIDSTGKEIINGTINDTLLSNGILLKDIEFDGLTKWYNLPEHLSVPYNNNNLTFNFIGVHMQSRNHVKYQYKLEGIDPDWSSITDRTEAPYGNLPSGDYVFKIKAMNQSGIWSEPLEYTFIVRPPWWQTWWFRTLVGVAIIGSIFYFIKSREKKLISEKEKLEKTVEERTAEVVEQKHVIEEKATELGARHKEITDSINYAERIQRSFLATEQHLNTNLKDYFIVFQPKAIVSGDFYWSATLKNGNFALATADSTGHGVPGAIMSLLNITSLEKAVETSTEPSDILNVTRRIIIDRLKKDGSPEGGKDGMDASLLVLNKEKTKLKYSAANNPVWVVRDNNLIELSADRMPVGKHEKDTIPFEEHEFELLKNDVIYTLTDGIPDQFGGPKGKKFMYKQLKEVLVSNSSEPMETQKQKLTDVFNAWKGNFEQTDDVCLIGVRV